MRDSGVRPDKYFPPTWWTLVVDARGTTPTARRAQQEFARRYERPVRDYIVAVFGHRQDVEDLAQGFFADVIVPGHLAAGADRHQGSFRPYLKKALRNYVIDHIRADKRKKRHAEHVVRPDDWSGEGWERLNLQTEDSPDAAFHRAWVRSLLQEALATVRATCAKKHQLEHFDLFMKRYLCQGPEPPSWKELGATVGIDEKAARSKTETVARHFRQVLRDMLAAEVGSDQSVDAEIAALLAPL